MRLSLANIRKYMYVEFYDGMFDGQIIEQFEKIVSRVLRIQRYNGEPPTIRERKYIIEALLEAYVNQTGRQPDGVQAQRLGNWLLLEQLTDSHPDKVTREEYPFLTKRQLRTRYFRERADDTIPETHTRQKYLGGTRSPSFRKSE